MIDWVSPRHCGCRPLTSQLHLLLSTELINESVDLWGVERHAELMTPDIWYSTPAVASLPHCFEYKICLLGF